MFKISVLTFLVTGASSQCYAVQFVQGVFTEQAAQGLGVKIRSEVVGTNQVGVWLEFSPMAAMCKAVNLGQVSAPLQGGCAYSHDVAAVTRRFEHFN